MWLSVIDVLLFIEVLPTLLIIILVVGVSLEYCDFQQIKINKCECFVRRFYIICKLTAYVSLNLYVVTNNNYDQTL